MGDHRNKPAGLRDILALTMAIEFSCSNPDCGQLLDVSIMLAGKRVKCPRCKQVTVAPGGGAVGPDETTPTAELVLPEAEMVGEGQSGREEAARPSLRPSLGPTPTPPAAHETTGAGSAPPDSSGTTPLRDIETSVMQTRDAGATASRIGGQVSPANPAVESLKNALEAARGSRLRYQMESEVAHGGRGNILLCIDRTLRRPVAMKVMRPKVAESEDSRARFLEEAQITGQLEHPNIVPIHELGMDASGDLYFTMKLVRGKSLGQILREMREAQERRKASPGEAKPQPTLPEMLQIFLKVCDGMAFAHSRGVIHRDLKPDNIMVGDFGEVLVMDWGLAKIVGQPDQPIPADRGIEPAPPATKEKAGTEGSAIPSGFAAAADQEREVPGKASAQDGHVSSVRAESEMANTQEGAITGTPAFMSTEQAKGQTQLVDHRSDIYSLGAILYQILTLERPVVGDTPWDILKKVARGEIVAPGERFPGRSIPPELSAIVMKAMNRDREQRYASAQELARDIESFLEHRPISAREDTLTESFVKLVKRNKTVSAAAGLALIFLVAFTSMLLVQQDKRLRDALEASRELAQQAVRSSELGISNEAEIAADAAAKLAPHGPWAPYARGVMARHQDDLAAAEMWLRKALEADPAHVPARTALAEALSAQGQPSTEASLVLDLVDVRDWRSLVAAADALYNTGDYSRAQAAYRTALQQMKSARDASPKAMESVQEKLGRATAWVKCQGFFASIQALPAERQAEEILNKLNELHPRSFEFQHEKAGGDLVRITVSGKAFRYLQPLQGLPLTSLTCRGTKVRDLSPLKGMALVHIDCGDTLVEDLSPLEGMPLTSLLCDSTQVKDLTPLTGMPLRQLSCDYSDVSDLNPLKGLPLESLVCDWTEVRDLAPLGGMPLRSLRCSFTKVKDLSPLRGLPLEALFAAGSKVTDLSPLRGMSLKTLHCSGTKVSDLAPLKGMPLVELNCGNTLVCDLSPLKGMPLASLQCSLTKVTDLKPIRGLALHRLHLSQTEVNDLSPVKEMPLEELDCAQTRVTDLSPIKRMNLRRFSPPPKSGLNAAGLKLVEKLQNEACQVDWE